MIEFILLKISSLIIFIILKTQYLGIFILMILSTGGIPIPSEIIMPFSGFLVVQNKLIFWKVILAGVLGNWLGAVILFFLGKKLRLASSKWKRFQAFFEKEINYSDRWFKKYGSFALLINYILPVVRSFISLPAGFFKLNFLSFNIFSLLGILIWDSFLTYFGFYLGENWKNVSVYFQKFDFIIFFLLIFAIIYFIIKFYRKYKKFKNYNN